jgi:iron(III) transport system substrate-binding protein
LPGVVARDREENEMKRCNFGGGMVLVLGLLSAMAASAAEVNVYSARNEALIKPALDRFTARTGVTVNLVTGKAGPLLQRLKSEGRNSPADLFITVDAGRLYAAKEAGVLQPVSSPALEAAVPAHLRDPEGYWFGLSLRARTIMYAKGRVAPAELSSYADLADPRWRGRICVRSSSNIYNQSLVASFIATQGEARTLAWLEGFVANLARAPKGGDRDQIKAVAAGQCDLALANSYYLMYMLDGDDPGQREAAGKVDIFWPDQDGAGTHVNVSGAGVTRAAAHRDDAVRLLEFLTSDEIQQWYADVNKEYPVRAGIPRNGTLARFGQFRADDVNLSRLGELNGRAVRLMDRAGWR